MISFNGFDELSHSSDVGYWLNTADTGGIVGKAYKESSKLGWVGINKIIIEAAVENERSNQVAQRAGFHLDGVSRSGILLDTGFTDVNIYSILRTIGNQIGSFTGSGISAASFLEHKPFIITSWVRYTRLRVE